MRLSSLQKYILLKCLEQGNRTNRKLFREFYLKQKKKPSEKYQEGIITKSLKRLIDKELMMGFGKRTPHKWFITHVKLTAAGKRMAKEVLRRRQKRLPFK